MIIISENWDCAGGPLVKNPPCNVGGTGSIPGLGTKMSHTEGKVTPCAPQLLSQGSRSYEAKL